MREKDELSGKDRTDGQRLTEALSAWEIVEEINRTGDIQPQAEYRGRCYSLVTRLPKSVDPYIRIDGKPTTCIDQHATYFTMLPAVLGSYRVSEAIAGEFHRQLAELRQFIVEAVECRVENKR